MMKFTGKLLPPQIDYLTGRTTLLFALNEDIRQTYEELKDNEVLSIEIKKYRKSRSLNANSYYWVLLTKLSKILKVSNNELHNYMISNYGYPEVIDGQLMRLSLPETKEVEKKVETSETYHLKTTTQIITGKDGKDYRTYILMRGSSTYNTEEMARLISGLITECKEVGIPDREIATPDEQRILKERYGIDL